ncbi:hypothetical protein A2635_02625 [Candidatus Peribacteria bacterium RIFCSPHIGHO2_01_FULL_51_9]|nr:MAG: hypothetical protein A2635_02625 [Candidatus Peribacteria bacterium RIFCSPHIGHO2_01_FULL_51_9]
MDIDPHSLHQIVQRISQQMRCPQCGKRIPVDMAAVRMTGDDFLLLQLKCSSCDAYIVLHATVAGNKDVVHQEEAQTKGHNVSSCLHFSEQEVTVLRGALEECGGSFVELFKKFGPEIGSPSQAPKT